MCGLVGIAGKLSFKDEATMKRLFIYDYFRGPDSTGLAALRNSGEVKLVKMASHPIDFFDSKKFIEALSGHTSRAFLGHNRAATLGKVNGLNAHPFQYGHIVGAHNGTLDLDSWKRLEDASGTTTDVDSAAIFACIEKIGIEETVALMQEGNTSVKGAWALTWIDTKENTLNFLRNKHRPFWYGFSKESDKILWASEWQFIRAAAGLSTHDYKLYVNEDGYSFWESEEDTWYKFDLEELAAGGKKPLKPETKELKGREPSPVVSNTGGGAPFHNTGTTTNGQSFYTDPDKDINLTKKPLLSLIGNSNYPLSTYMNEEDFEEIAKYGCSWCQEAVDYEDVGVAIWDNEDLILCPKCSGHSEHSRIYTTLSKFEAFQTSRERISA